MSFTLKRSALCWLCVTCMAGAAVPVGAWAAGAEYVGRDGGRLVRGGRPIHLHGATLYGANYQNPAEFKKHVDAWLDLARGQGLNLIRAVNFYNHTTDWLDPTTWSSVDYLFSAAGQRGMYVELDLSAYRNGLWHGGGVNPYADPSAWNEFLDFVGGRYKGRENLAFYALAGEIVGPNYGDEPKVSGQGYVDFFRATSDRLRAADPNHLISSGGFLHLNDPKSGIPWKAIFGLPNIAMAAVHVYSDPKIQNNDDVQAAMAVAEWARRQNLPFTIEEFGAVQSVGDAARADLYERRYTLGSLTGSVATVFWNLGAEDRGDSHDVGPQTPEAWAAVAAGGTYFRDTFDDEFPKPTWTDEVESSKGVVGISGEGGPAPQCGVRGKVAHSGPSALMVSGSAPAALAENHCDFKVFRVGLLVRPQTKMRFRLYPEGDNARYVSVDLHCTDGTRLRDTKAVDQNGHPVRPSAGHGGGLPLGAWATIECDVGKWLEGKVVDEIVVGYDRPDAAGPFRGYIDDLLITNGSLD